MVNPMVKVKITQVRSMISRPQRQRLTLAALGLRRINSTVTHEATPQVMGMIKQVSHLVKVEEA